ncbi:HAMP domain-containing sensor histidine kinase [Streptomyces sp. NPDC091215]|uniref:sensor histidine kinase n=1 Tax=Streptomyces sp. NPDC091215 TaxID=3155192 RepID=UPI0034123094
MRGRVALAICLVAMLAVTVFGLITALPAMALAQRTQDRERQYVLLESALSSYGRDGTLVPGARLNDASLPAPLANVARRGRAGAYISSGGAPRVYAAAGVSGKVLSIPAVSVEQDPLRLAERDLLPGGVFVAAFVGVLGWFTAHGLTRRVRHGAVAARGIASGQPVGPAPRLGEGQWEAVELSQALRDLASVKERQETADRELAAGVAHELRTPVTGLVTASDLLPHPRAVEMVRVGVQRMRSLVEELDELSRLDAGTERPHREPVDLASVVRGVVACLPDHGRETVSVTVVGEGRMVMTDPRRVQRILAMLLDNAVKHGRAPVVVTVDGARIVVRDHGPGLPQELLQDGPRRFRTGAFDRGTGRGLGLSIAAGQAVVLGGRLRLGAAAGGGAEAAVEIAEGPVE